MKMATKLAADMATDIFVTFNTHDEHNANTFFNAAFYIDTKFNVPICTTYIIMTSHYNVTIFSIKNYYD